MAAETNRRTILMDEAVRDIREGEGSRRAWADRRSPQARRELLKLRYFLGLLVKVQQTPAFCGPKGRDSIAQAKGLGLAR
jgi:hypothetical protein